MNSTTHPLQKPVILAWHSPQRLALLLLEPLSSGRIFLLALRMVLPLLLLTLWKVATDRVWVPPQILPPPEFVWETLVDMVSSGELFSHSWVSIRRVLWSMLIGGGGGFALGVLIALSRPLRPYIYPSFSLVSQFPVIGWTPLLIIFFGVDEALKISSITISVIVPMAVATIKGIENVPPRLLEVGQAYCFSFFQTFRHIVLPAATPALLGGLRQSFLQAWLALVFIELMASTEGLGNLLAYSRQIMQLDVVMVCMAAIGVIGVCIDKGLDLIESRLTRWLPKRAAEGEGAGNE